MLFLSKQEQGPSCLHHVYIMFTSCFSQLLNSLHLKILLVFILVKIKIYNTIFPNNGPIIAISRNIKCK